MRALLVAGTLGTGALLLSAVDPRRALPINTGSSASAEAGATQPPYPDPAIQTLSVERTSALDGTFGVAPSALASGELAVVNARGELRVLAETRPDLVRQALPGSSSVVALSNGTLVISAPTGVQGFTAKGDRAFLNLGAYRPLAPLPLPSGGFMAIQASAAAFFTGSGELLRTMPLRGTVLGAPWVAGGGIHVVLREGENVSVVRLAEAPVLAATFRSGVKSVVAHGTSVVLAYDRSVLHYDLASRETHELSNLEGACTTASDGGALAMGVRQGHLVLQSSDAAPRTLDLGLAPLGDGGAPDFSCAVYRDGPNFWFATSTGRVGVSTSRNGLVLLPDAVCTEGPPVALDRWGSGIVVLCSQGQLRRIRAL